MAWGWAWEERVRAWEGVWAWVEEGLAGLWEAEWEWVWVWAEDEAVVRWEVAVGSAGWVEEGSVEAEEGTEPLARPDRGFDDATCSYSKGRTRSKGSYDIAYDIV